MPEPQRFRSRPQEIEAIQWTGDNLDELWDAFTAEKIYGPIPEDENLYLLAGKDGAQDCVPVPVGHWIVRNPGDTSDYWPVGPDYFASKYEGVVAQSDRAPGTPGTSAGSSPAHPQPSDPVEIVTEAARSVPWVASPVECRRIEAGLAALCEAGWRIVRTGSTDPVCGDEACCQTVTVTAEWTPEAPDA